MQSNEMASLDIYVALVPVVKHLVDRYIKVYCENV